MARVPERLKAGRVEGASVPGEQAADGGSQAASFEAARHRLPARLRRAVAFRNAAAMYMFVFMFVVFALWVPQTFLTWGTWRSLLSDQAITSLVAVGLVVPIAAGALDLAVGAEVGLGAVLVAWLLVSQHVGIPAAIGLSLLGGAGVGVFSWLMITRARIPSFIAT
ncbi:MAG: ABC transporter permease, partial [Candidatus Dormibacteraeota bacterium]|nr:ABC transporter permease [Candidatus Dormibacteraeota bacterium]